LNGQETAAADSREKTSGNQKIMLDKRKLARNVPDNNSVIFQRKLLARLQRPFLANNG
jgi:hypothetical protein